MALPMKVAPIYTMKLPSTKEDIRYRPFLVKEEKALVLAQLSGDTGVMYETVKEVIRACIKDPLNIEKLAPFDIEYMFLQLRIVSVGETSDLLFACDDCGNTPESLASVTVNLPDVQVVTPPEHTNKINLFDDVGVVMKYPNSSTVAMMYNTIGDDVDTLIKIVASCIDYIYDSSEVYKAEDTSEAELVEFVSSLSATQFNKIQEFFDTMPTLRHDIQYMCPQCGLSHNKYIQGIASFF